MASSHDPSRYSPTHSARRPRRSPTPATLRPLSSAYTGVPERPSLAVFLDHWLAHVAWARLRFSTARTYAGVVANIIVPVLGRRKVRSLTAADIEKAGLVWQHARVTRWMRRKAVEVLRSALNHAVALALCEVNVARRTRIPRKQGRPPVWLELAAARRLIRDVRGHPLECAYTLAIALGLRRGEITGLTWGDVHLAQRRLQVRWTRTEYEGGTRLTAPKTAASRRTLAMPELVFRSLRDQLGRERAKARRAGAEVRPEDAVLTTRNRRPYSSGYLYQDLRRRLGRLGLPAMRLHDLRHTAASLMLAEGVPPRTVMEMMGHRNLEVTMLIYGHTSLDQQRKAAMAVDRAFRRRRT
jgi:integrase